METKSWYKSRVLWCAVLAVIAQVLVLIGVFAPDVDTTELQEKLKDPTTVDQILNIITIALSVGAVFFRVKTKTEITK